MDGVAKRREAERVTAGISAWVGANCDKAGLEAWIGASAGPLPPEMLEGMLKAASTGLRVISMDDYLRTKT